MSARSIEIGLALAAATFLVAVPWLIPVLADDFWVSVITEILIWSPNVLFIGLGLWLFIRLNRK